MKRPDFGGVSKMFFSSSGVKGPLRPEGAQIPA
jgi:hypothetical protein